MTDRDQRGLGMLGMLGMTGSDMADRTIMCGDMEDHDQGLRVVPISVHKVRTYLDHCG